MVSIVTKRIKGIDYLYLVESIRKKDKIIQKHVKYIGKKRPISKDEFECMKISAKDEDWILKETKDELSYQDHQKLKNASENYKIHLRSLDELSRVKEKEKFLSLFISNSNAIEGSTLTVDETFNFLFEDIIPKNHNKKELFMATNLLDAWNYLESNSSQFPKKDDLLEMHRLVNRGIETDETLGKYKKVQNYIGKIPTTSHLYVEEKIEMLLQWIKQAFKIVDDFEISFQSHAQFEIIHPFIDGNGRVGRLLMNWLLMYKNRTYFAIPVNKRLGYLSALENSRRGKVEAICKFCFNEYISEHKFL